MMKKPLPAWPDGAACAVMITVNLDGAYAARSFDADVDVTEGSSAEIMARDGMEAGLPRLLSVLDDYDVKATFFVQGRTASSFPESLQLILEKGHEIGCRGHENENLALLTQDEQLKIIKQSREAIRNNCGVTPTGFRAPGGELTLETLNIAKDLGFLYSSSLSDDDTPYFLDVYTHATSDDALVSDNEAPPAHELLLEIPIHAALYDYPYFVFHFDPPIPQGQSRISFGDDVLTNWKWEFDGYHQYGGCFVLQLDPQITGSQGRIYLLEELLAYMKHKGNCWFATGTGIYRYLR